MGTETDCWEQHLDTTSFFAVAGMATAGSSSGRNSLRPSGTADLARDVGALPAFADLVVDVTARRANGQSAGWDRS
jgi:hypothetical protein